MTKPVDTKILAPITERFQCEVSNLSVKSIGIARLETYYFRVQVESLARARGGRVVAIKGFQTYLVPGRDAVRVTAMVQLEPWDEEAEEDEKRRGLMIRRQNTAPYNLAGEWVEPTYIPTTAPQTATEVRAKAIEIMAQVSPEVRDRIARQFDAVALGALLGSQPVYEAKPATPPPPPKPVPQIRSLDLDEASEVALPTQKGRAIDLE